tara:strand:+ start:424 stop:627 length:204 start_codon:yes stop_codon:yes gene_type:complete
MPNPLKYKSVSLTLSAYDKLVYVSEIEDRSIGRQLSRLVDQAYENVKPLQAFSETKNRYGIESVIED